MGYIAGGMSSPVQEGAFGDCMTPPPSPAFPSQKWIEDKVKAVGLLEATQLLLWVREVLTEWVF